MQKTKLKQVQRKIDAWKAKHPGPGQATANLLKEEVLALLGPHSLPELSHRLSIPLSTLYGWQKTKKRPRQPLPHHTKKLPLHFHELQVTPVQDDAALMLRRIDGASLEVKGALTNSQLQSLTQIFLENPL